ncbi:hypothetical protein TNIN_97041 [Trichonephila inaurata madagascariensis]|uniref:Uncharacterized protein n=1 Tax=Trichonephila inaurata madagascariensis TaxID=2747483 RepID=A0A8X6XSP0_9ARAC|nr:hypothetical protein TNIN_97041 [Trichonephila inaurata madagascariensis]
MKKSVVLKKTSFEISRKVVRKHHSMTVGIVNGVIDITVSCLRNMAETIFIAPIGNRYRHFVWAHYRLRNPSKYCPECTTAKRDLEKIVLSTPYGTNHTRRMQRKAQR